MLNHTKIWNVAEDHQLIDNLLDFDDVLDYWQIFLPNNHYQLQLMTKIHNIYIVISIRKFNIIMNITTEYYYNYYYQVVTSYQLVFLHLTNGYL